MNTSLLAKINELYGLKITSAKKIDKGFLSENYCVTTEAGTRYFLKKYRFDNSERIKEIHAAKKYFSDGGIPVIMPITHRDGNSFFLFENGYFALFPFISDRQFDRGELSSVATTSLGEMLGKIHLLGKLATLPMQEKFKPWNKANALKKIGLIREAIDRQPNTNDFDRLVIESLETKRKLVADNTLEYEDLALPSDHLIHGDYLDTNVFFGKDGSVSFVFDFEKTDYSPRMYELWRSFMYSFLSGNDIDSGIIQARLYLDAYVEIYPTSLDELQRGLDLFYLKAIHSTWVEGEHYLLGNNRADEFLIDDLKRIKYLSEKKTEILARCISPQH